MNAWQWRNCWCLLLILQATHALSSGALGEVAAARRTNTDWAELEGDVTPAKRNPILSRWGGQRLSDLLYYKRRPAFSSWGGKRGPAFSSWGGKRSMPVTGPDPIQYYSRSNSTDLTNNQTHTTSHSPDSDTNQYNLYQLIKNAIDKANSENSTNLDYNRQTWMEDQLARYNEDLDDEYNKASEEFNLEEQVSNKRAAPSFNSWGGKRAAAVDWRSKWIPEFNHWQGKKATAFNSWGGKRAPAFNSWGGKRAPAFNSWGGKRAPAFNSWGGKRAPAFNSWGGKRIPQFNSQNELQENYQQEPEDTITKTYRQKRSIFLTNSKENNLNDHWEEDEYANNNEDENRPVLSKSWEIKRAPAFNSWGGKRAPAFNSWGGKRAPAFNSWGGKRAPAFNSWGGKRAPAFNSWGGKRAPAFNSWGGKRAPAFNSWGGKRAPAFNSWGGKRAPAFNSWGGKRAPAFNSWGGKRDDQSTSTTDKIPSFDNWEDIEESVNYSTEGMPTSEDPSHDKRTVSYAKGSGKRLPAFHSWGGKRFKSLTTLTPNEKTVNFLGSGTDQNHPLNAFGDEAGKPMETQELDTMKSVDEKSRGWLNDEMVDHLVKRDPNDENEMKRNPAFFSWGGKRNLLEDDKSVEEIPEELNDYSDNESYGPKVYKRNLGFGKFNNADKRRPVFSSWGGKRSVVPDEDDGKVRRKRYAEAEANNEIALIMTGNDVFGDGISPPAANEIYSELPTEMMCCIKRAQYGDRNLFMQMLLRTKSFRDLSWPTIRPIRRGADFYPWGGKRSL